MLRFTHKAGNILHYEIHGKLSTADLHIYYATIETYYQRHGKLSLMVRVHDFGGYAGLCALLIFARHEPGLLRKVKRYAAVAEQRWLREIINAIDTLLPAIRFRAFRPRQKDEAANWLLCSG